MQIDVKEFTDWVATKPPEMTYPYFDGERCPMAQFLRHKGLINPSVGGRAWDAQEVQPETRWWRKPFAANRAVDVKGEIPSPIARTLALSHSFGSLAKEIKRAVRDGGGGGRKG